MNGWDSMSPTVPPISVMITSGSRRLIGLQPHAALDLVGDVRDDLHGVAEVLAAALARDHLRVDLPGRDVRGLAELDVEEALVVPDVEIGLGAVVGDEDLAVLERIHRARIDVQVGVELLHHDAQSARGEQIAQARGGQTFAQRGNDTPGHEDVPGGAVGNSADEDSGVRSYPPHEYPPRRFVILSVVAGARASSSSRAWVRAASESGMPDSSRAISASRSTPSRRRTSDAVTEPSLAFTTDRWLLAKAATWARWVTAMTCDDLARRASRRPTSIAAAPPMPASTSSKTKVGTGSTAGDDDLDREHDATELATGRAPGDGSRLGSGVRREKDRDVIAARARLRSRRDCDLDARIGHGEGMQLLGDGGGEARGRFGARGGQRSAQRRRGRMPRPRARA